MAALGSGAIEAISPQQHLALLSFLCDEALDTLHLHNLLQSAPFCLSGILHLRDLTKQQLADLCLPAHTCACACLGGCRHTAALWPRRAPAQRRHCPEVHSPSSKTAFRY